VKFVRIIPAVRGARSLQQHERYVAADMRAVSEEDDRLLSASCGQHGQVELTVDRLRPMPKDGKSRPEAQRNEATSE